MAPKSAWVMAIAEMAKVILLGLMIMPLGAQDWPQHRGGPDLRGLATGSKLGEKLKLLWTFETGEFVKSSAVAHDGRVFIGSDTGKLHAIDLKTGKELWFFKTELAIEAAPLVVENTVYVGSTDGFLYAFRAKDGKLLWKYQTDAEIIGAANHALRPQSKDRVIIVGSYDNFVHCVGAQNGKGLWKFETSNYINGVPTILEGDKVVFGGCDAVLYVVGLENGKLKRSVEVEAPIAASVAVADGIGYVGHFDNAVMAFDLDTGDVVWTYRAKNFPYYSSPAVTNKHCLIGGRDKGLHCIDRITGKSAWRFASRGRIDSSPVVCGDKVVFGSMDGKLHIVALKDGKEVASYDIGESISSTPAVVGSSLIVGCEDGNVYAFETNPK
jgi:eukaryotic-like serine/threonine-protein kinase